MHEVQKDITKWLSEGFDVALAQVIRTSGSAPRSPGSVMAVTADRRLSGSVSGGCVEGAVIDAAMECLSSGQRRVEMFHASFNDDLEFAEVGLACGGNIDVLITRLQPQLFAVECEEIRLGNEYIRVTAIDSKQDFVLTKTPGKSVGQILTQVGEWYLHFPRKGVTHQEFLVEAAAQIIEASCHGSCVKDGHTPTVPGTGILDFQGHQFFYHRVTSKPKLICVGGVHISVHLTQLAKSLGYKTIVIDPRGVFSSPERFPYVDEFLHQWPQQAFEHLTLDSATALCALSHDPKIDIPALEAALSSPAFYIGCLGRTTTQLERYQDLQACGFSDEELSRIYGPIGLNLGGRSPAEIALSIMAEITLARFGGDLPTRTMVDSARLGAMEQR